MLHGVRLARSLNIVLSAALVGLGFSAVGIVAGSGPATAALSLSCNGIYALQGATDPRNVWQVDPLTGALSSTGTRFTSLTSTGSLSSPTTGTLGAMGLSDDGRFVYSVASEGSAREILRYDRATASYVRLGAGQAGAPTTHGAVDPVDGIFYYGGLSGLSQGRATLRVYGFDPDHGSLGLVASGSIPAAGTEGDWAFDSTGRLYVVASGASSVVSVVDQAIPSSRRWAPAGLTARQLLSVPGPVTGLAFGGQGDRRLYLADSTTIRTVDPGTGRVLGSRGFTGGTGAVDLASCASPDTITVRSTFPEGRLAAADHAGVALSGAGLQASGASGSTGPVLGLDGTTYTFSAGGRGTAAPRYVTTYQCVDERTGSALAGGSGTTGTLTLPSSTSSFGTSAVCTFASVAQSPAVQLQLIPGTPTGDRAGATVGWTIRVTNTGDVDLATVDVTDDLLGAVTCPVGPLAPGASEDCTAGVHQLTQGEVDAGSVTNSATVTADTGIVGLPTPTDSTSSVVSIPAAPGLALTVTAQTPLDVNGSGLVDAGDTIAYTFAVTNSGNVPVSGVALADPGLGGTVACDTALLAPGASTACRTTAVHTITTDEQSAGRVLDSATASGTLPNGTGYSAAPVSTTTAVQQPAPGLTLTATAGPVTDVDHDGLTDTGDTIGYSFTVHNSGNVPLTGVRVSAPRIGSVTCPTAVLPVGGTTTCASDADYTVTPADVSAGEVRTTGTAQADAPDVGTTTSAPSTSVVPAAAPAAALGLVTTVQSVTDVDGDGLTDAGDRIVWTYTITSTGNVPVDGIRVDDPKAGPVTCPGSALAPTAQRVCSSAPYTVTADDVLAGRVQSTATVSGTGPNGTATTSAPSTVTTLTTAPAPGLGIDVRAGTPVDVDRNGVTDAGDTIAYQVVVSNTGNVRLSGVRIDDPLLAAQTPPITVACPTTTLAVGASTTCTASAPYTITAAQQSAQVASNTATASATDPDGTTVTSDPDSVNVPVSSSAAVLTLDLQAGTPVDVNNDGLTDAGDTIAYAYTVTNGGNVTITGITVTDPLVGAVTCAATTLAAGASTQCSTAAYVITAADVTAGTVRNTAHAGGTAPGGATVTSNDDTTTTSTAAATTSLTFDKSAGAPVDVNRDGLTDAGDTIAYTFTVTNAGNVAVTGVQVVDTKVGGITCTTTGTLGPGAVRTCTSAPYVVTAADVAAGSVTNTAVATGTAAGGAAVRSPSDSTTTATGAPLAAVVVTLTGHPPVDANGSGVTDAGDTITYDVTVTNTGNVPVSAVAVTTRLAPAPVCAVTVLAPRATTQCTAPTPYVITAADQSAGSVVDVAVATAQGPDGDPIRSTSVQVAIAVVTPAPALSVDLSAGPPSDNNADGLVDAGDTIVYSYLVTNTGNVPLNGIGILDAKVGGVLCAAGSLAPGDTTTCTSGAYVVTAADVAAGAIVNTARAQGSDSLGTTYLSPTDSTSTSTSAPIPTLVLDATQQPPVDVNADGLVDAGDTIDWSVTVTDTGNVAVTGLVVLDRLGLPVTCDVVALAPRGVAHCATTTSYTITAADQATGGVTDVFAARAADPDRATVVSNSDQTIQLVTAAAPALSLVKRAAPPVDVNEDGLTDAGDTIVYTFVITNSGNVTLTDIGVQDAKVSGVVCPVTPLAPGEQATCTSAPYVVTLADEAAGAVKNSARAVGLSAAGVAVLSPAASVSTPVVTPAPALGLVKRAAPPVDVNGSGTTDAGDTVQYSFTVTNTGNVPLTGVGVDDPTAGTVSCDLTTLAPKGSLGDTAQCRADAPYIITAAQETARVASNTATATAVAPGGAAVVSDPDTVNVPVTQDAPLLTFDKHAGTPVDANDDDLIDAGDTILYSFTVTNDGNVPVRNVAIVDTKAGAASCASLIVLAGQAVTCVADAPYVITRADVVAGYVRNTAHATGVDAHGGPVISNDDSTTTPTDSPAASLGLVVAPQTFVDVNGSGIVDAGDTLRFAYVVTDNGNTPVTGVAVVDGLGLPVRCDRTSLVPGAETQCTTTASYVITTADEQTGSVSDTAIATGVDSQKQAVLSNPGLTTQAVETPAPALLLNASAEPSVDANLDHIVDAGDTIVYRFDLTNTGNVPLSGIVVNDLTARGITCSILSLAPGSTTSCTSDAYVISAADQAKGSVVDSANATAFDPDGGRVVSNDDSTTTRLTTPRAELVLHKTVDGPPTDVNGDGLVDAGDTIHYAFEVHDIGNVPVNVVGVSDPKLGGRVVCERPTLDFGQVTSCTGPAYTITAADERAGVVVNAATATGVDGSGNPVVSAVAFARTELDRPRPALTLDKRAGVPVDVNKSGIVDPGDTIRYTFVVTNSGNAPVTAVHVVDRLVGAVSCPVTTLLPGARTTCTADKPYVVTAADAQAGSVDNNATATGTGPDGTVVTSAEDATATAVTLPRPALRVSATATLVETNGDQVAEENEHIAYRYVVTNTGNVPVHAIEIVDTKAGAVHCAATTLAPGVATDCTEDVWYVVKHDDVVVGYIKSSSTADGLSPDDVAVVSDATTTKVTATKVVLHLVIDQTAVLRDRNHDGIAEAGEEIDYGFTVTNGSNFAVSDLVVTDPALPGGISCEVTGLGVGEESAHCVPKQTPVLVTPEDVKVGGIVSVATASAVGGPDKDVVAAVADIAVTRTGTEADASEIVTTPVVIADGRIDHLDRKGGSVRWLYLVGMALIVGFITIAAGLFRRPDDI